MSTEESMSIEGLTGIASALSIVVTSLVQELEPISAARCAVRLAMSLEDAKLHDKEDGTHQETQNSRNAIAQSYLELMRSVAEN